MPEMRNRIPDVIKEIEDGTWTQDKADRLVSLLDFDLVQFGHDNAIEAIQRTRDADDELNRRLTR